MINSTAVRVGIVAVLILLTSLGANWINASLQSPGTEMPAWTFHDLPKQLGGWRGEDSKMDPVIAEKTGANLDTIIERVYRDNVGHNIAMHAATFDNPAAGVIHSPLICYASAGWKKLSETGNHLQLSTKLTGLPDELTIPVSISTWENERDNKKVVVVYWYQLGKYFLFGRLDLGIKIRWALAGKQQWPALIKVMMEMPIMEGEDPNLPVLDFAEQVAVWENQSSHRCGKGMLGTQTQDANSGSKPSP
jgi:hypothetical protein